MNDITSLDDVRAAKARAKPHKPRAKAAKAGGALPPAEPPPPDEPPGGGGGEFYEDPRWPKFLPPDCPVKPLGCDGEIFYFLSALGQFRILKDKDVSMNPILNLFAGDSDYLRTWWPKMKGKHVINFDHAMMREVLIRSCARAGIWSPDENVRGVGAWAEDDGTLVMHCGDKLFLSNGTEHATGLRGRLLYPAAPKQPHPERFAGAGAGGPCDVLLQKVATWNWERGKLDAILCVAWIVAAMLGAAPDWRAIGWITGGTGTGKSTLFRLIGWLFGVRGIISSEDATPAGVKQRVGHSSIPVKLDELENEVGSDIASQMMKVARRASSGGESLRGSPSGAWQGFALRNAFIFSGIVMPSLPQQDMNRLFIGVLNKVEWAGREKPKVYEPSADVEDGEDSEDDNLDPVLGSRAEWNRIGGALRRRLLSQWPRYRRTRRAYRDALAAAGHNDRGQDQFGALGAAFDLAYNDGFDGSRALAFAQRLPAAELAETAGYSASHENCLAHLLGYAVDAWKGGAKESIGVLLHEARKDREDKTSNSKPSAMVLEQMGIKVFRDARVEDGDLWWIAVCNSHTGLQRVFRETDWNGKPGTPGAWARMLGRLKDAQVKGKNGKPLRLRFAKRAEYCVALPWDEVFPPMAAGDDDAEMIRVADRDD